LEKEKLRELTLLAIEVSFHAGSEILKIYENTISVDYKTDGSPLTEADKASHRIITEHLQISGLPILSEEGRDIAFDERNKWNYYWCVDPLDGTKEFIKRNGEFTVNIALMENNSPIAGVVYLPVKKVAYAGVVGDGLYKIRIDGSRKLNPENKIPAIAYSPGKSFRVIASRSHESPETKNFVDELQKKHKEVELLSAGSALKFCKLAEGKADVYPRFAPTMEWDTAAGHALLKAVGKNIYLHPSGFEMTYNKPGLINEWFIAR
jgi:3'(2'), 5'-bisphosphate nucleotidase